jgi:GNAT superfamily N-acetyltransferase
MIELMTYKTIIGDLKVEQEQVRLGNKAWPEFMQHDPILEGHWSCLYTDFLDFQFAAYSDHTLAGVGNAVPIYWEDDFHKLPAGGLDWAMVKSMADRRKGLHPNVLVGVQILVNPDFQGKGLSYYFLDLMKDVAKHHGIPYMAMPLRPTQKHVYPLIPMEEYLSWTNEDMEPFDAWIRVHIKTGGSIVSVCSESMTIRGSVSDWEEWTGLTFPSSGEYIVYKALCPVKMDLEKNMGTYTEPNIWIIHSV